MVMGVADAVHIATYYVGSTLLEQLNERFGGPAASAYAARGGGPVGLVPGGMQVVPYLPQPANGNYGRPDNYANNNNNRRQDPRQHLPPQPYGAPYGAPQTHGPGPAVPMYGAQAGVGAYGAQLPPHHAVPHHGAPHHGVPHHGGPQAHGPHGGQPMHGGPSGPGGPAGGIPGAALTQQIYIPNDMVGAIIGKGGMKINEIRTISGSMIKINEPQDNSNERLVTISGSEECNRMALYMLYSRLGKSI